jgi:hypothetical protein
MCQLTFLPAQVLPEHRKENKGSGINAEQVTSAMGHWLSEEFFESCNRRQDGTDHQQWSAVYAQEMGAVLHRNYGSNRLMYDSIQRTTVLSIVGIWHTPP